MNHTPLELSRKICAMMVSDPETGETKLPIVDYTKKKGKR